MKKSFAFKPLFYFLIVIIFMNAPLAMPLEYESTGTYVMPAKQSGYAAEQYEVGVGKKLLRGAENFFLGPLEIPQGIKSEIGHRKQDFLPVGIETVFIGTFKGILFAGGRMAVGFFEGITCIFPQEPILPEMEDWAY